MTDNEQTPRLKEQHKDNAQPVNRNAQERTRRRRDRIRNREEHVREEEACLVGNPNGTCGCGCGCSY